jgi:hypothetical protein
MAKTIPDKDIDFDEVQNVITTKTTENLNNWQIDKNWYVTQLNPAKPHGVHGPCSEFMNAIIP